MSLKPKTLQHLAVTRQRNREVGTKAVMRKPSNFLKSLTQTADVKSTIRKSKKARKALATKLKEMRKEHGNAPVRAWHRAGGS